MYLKPVLAIETRDPVISNKMASLFASTFTTFFRLNKAKCNKHRHDLKKQNNQTDKQTNKQTTMPLYRYVHKENIFADPAPYYGSQKRDNQKFRFRVGSSSAHFFESSWSYSLFKKSFAFKYHGSKVKVKVKSKPKLKYLGRSAHLYFFSV